jgi:hypothetical protein
MQKDGRCVLAVITQPVVVLSVMVKGKESSYDQTKEENLRRYKSIKTNHCKPER